MAASKNLCAKMRPLDQPYEVWQGNGFEWRVLKKWQANDYKPFARWYCATKSPYTFGEWEYGDGYAKDIMRHGHLVSTDYPTNDTLPSARLRAAAEMGLDPSEVC